VTLDEYQSQAVSTYRPTAIGGNDTIVTLLGLAGETGELLSEYKKYLHQGTAHQQFRRRLVEELGDLLWYLADAATKFDLRLSDVAISNLNKVRERWGEREDGQPTLYGQARIFDAGYPESERLPRSFTADFVQIQAGTKLKIRVLVNGVRMGQELTDNAHNEDGYRFHDVFHLACAAVLGWSPVTRRNLNRKRRSNPEADEVEDGGRAIVTEEGISALVFAYASDHAFLKDVQAIDHDVLKAIKIMTAKFEVGVCTSGEWEKAILIGYSVWKQVQEHAGGQVIVDLDRRVLSYEPPRLPETFASPAGSLKATIKALHAQKDAAYGNAWKRRGELTSILANIARKIDRLDAFLISGGQLSDESLLDTAIDLFVYVTKYRLYLCELAPAECQRLLPSEPPQPLSDFVSNFDHLVDLSHFADVEAVSLNELVAQGQHAFDDLHREASLSTSSPADRLHLASHLSDVAIRIILSIAHGEVH
jgi:NTP pyrophosphatase (non-canonical NTP hydrolase)